MNKKIIVLIAALVVMANMSQAQLLFGVKPGLLGNSAHIGLKLGGLMVFGGLE